MYRCTLCVMFQCASLSASESRVLLSNIFLSRINSRTSKLTISECRDSRVLLRDFTKSSSPLQKGHGVRNGPGEARRPETGARPVSVLLPPASSSRQQQQQHRHGKSWTRALIFREREGRQSIICPLQFDTRDHGLDIRPTSTWAQTTLTWAQ